MSKQLIFIFLISAFLIFCMFRPFMPGRYDQLAVPISFMVQIFSITGLSWVPLGALWLISVRDESGFRKWGNRFLIYALILSGLLALLVSVAPFSQNNTSFAVLFLAFVSLVLGMAYGKIKNSAPLDRSFHRAILIYLILIPLLVFTSRFLFMERAVQFSRDLAIRNSAGLIQKIEDYFKSHGQYPVSLQALHSDIVPGVVGIPGYFYEPNGQAYNLYFKPFSDELDADEIVMYNKQDEHRFSAHDLDLLEYSGEALALRRGDRRRSRLSAPHWISIKFE